MNAHGNNMQSSKIFLKIIVVGCLSMLSTALYAANFNGSRSRPSMRTGLYQKRLHGYVSFAADALYYYGDIEGGNALLDPNVGNMGAGGVISYHHAVAQQVKMRYSIGGGWLQGDDQKKEGQRSFDAYYARVAAGVEWYPIAQQGFYLYAGILVQYNHVVASYLQAPNDKPYTFLPMIPFEVGYNFKVADSWQVGVHIGIAQGMIDTQRLSLDAFAQGKGGLPDGHCQFGVTIAYGWDKY